MPPKNKKTQAGFTLIEFVISSALTMALLAATFTLMNSLFTANTGVIQVLNTQQNIRVALNAVTRDITMAGTGLPDSGIPVPNGTNSTKIARPGLNVTCGASTVGCLPTTNNVLPILSPGDGVGVVVASATTDALTIALVDQTSPTWTVLSIGTNATSVTFTQNVRDAGTYKLNTNDLLLFNNANGSAFGNVTSVATTTTGLANFADGVTDLLGINQSTAQFGNMTQTLRNPASNPVTYPPTTATRVLLITYYINNSNPQTPKLMRSVNALTPQVMVENVENLQFSFDLYDDVNNTESANVATTSNPNQIRAVRVAINAHSTDLMPRSKEYFHFGMVSKVNVRNATFRNRYS